MKTTTTHERFIDINEAAIFLSTKVSWIHQNHKHLQIPSHKLGRKLRFRITELDFWLTNKS